MYFKLETRPILSNCPIQNFNIDILYTSLIDCYKNCAFSTFPYILYNCNSYDAITKYKCGNCIALSMYIKLYLKKKNIESYLIPATIPDIYNMKGYLDICHVALLVPQNKHKFFILDPAFYFLNPIQIDMNLNKTYISLNKDIYQKETKSNFKNYVSINKVYGKLINIENNNLFNKYQQLPKNTYAYQCNYSNSSNDKWKYFLVEILNPDKSITNFFLNIKKDPFIVTTILDKNGICTSSCILKTKDKKIYIKDKDFKQEIFVISKTNEINQNFKKILRKFFSQDITNELQRYYQLKNLDKYKATIDIND